MKGGSPGDSTDAPEDSTGAPEDSTGAPEDVTGAPEDITIAQFCLNKSGTRYSASTLSHCRF
jgi:hypothetical protein